MAPMSHVACDPCHPTHCAAGMEGPGTATAASPPMPRVGPRPTVTTVPTPTPTSTLRPSHCPYGLFSNRVVALTGTLRMAHVTHGPCHPTPSLAGSVASRRAQMMQTSAASTPGRGAALSGATQSGGSGRRIQPISMHAVVVIESDIDSSSLEEPTTDTDASDSSLGDLTTDTDSSEEL